jgi:hypothetical protein
MEPEIKTYGVLAPDEVSAKREGRAHAYQDGFIRTSIVAARPIQGRVAPPYLKVTSGPKQGQPLSWWEVDVLVRERRTTEGSKFLELLRVPTGALIETTAPSIFVVRGTTSPIPVGTRGKVIGRVGGMLRVKLDGTSQATLIAAEGLNVVALGRPPKRQPHP